MNKLEVKCFGLALGIVWCALIFILGLFDMLYFWGNNLTKIISFVCIGYQPTVLGVIFSSLWAFIYASLIGVAFAWFYNRLLDENEEELQRKTKELAHQIWLKKGCPEGTAEEDWREAERIIRGKKD